MAEKLREMMGEVVMNVVATSGENVRSTLT
jgi:hypothetical protein